MRNRGENLKSNHQEIWSYLYELFLHVMAEKINTFEEQNSSLAFDSPINLLPLEVQTVFSRFSVEFAADEVFWMQEDSKILYVNDSACRHLGYSRGELLQMYVWDWDPLFTKEHWQEFFQVIKEKKKMFFETKHRTKSGEVFPVEISSHSLEYKGRTYLFAFVKDISERKRIEEEIDNHRNHLEDLVIKRTEELENTLKKLETTQAELLQSQKLQAIGQLAAGIAHEINTPSQYVASNLTFLRESVAEIVQALRAGRQLFENEQNDTALRQIQDKFEHIAETSDLDYLLEEIPAALASCENGIEQISKIVNALKNLTTTRDGMPEPVQIKPLIESIVEVSRNEWKSLAELETVLDPELETIFGLKDALGQALLNLIVNAAQAIEDRNGKEGNRGLIRIVTKRDGDWGELRIEDNGCGIDPSLQHRIFDPFFTTKEVGRGSGQGLAIAHNVVTEKHHGTIRVQSEPECGSTIIIRLPLQD